MRVEEEYVKTGYFWLPERAENKIPGILTVKDGGDIELEVVGLFDESIKSFNGDDDISRIIGCVEKDGNVTLDESIKSFNGDDDISRIIGCVEKDGNVTLDDCFYTKKSIPCGGISKSKVYVKRLLGRVAYDKDEEVTFNTLSFSVDCMDEWVGISGITVDSDWESWTTKISYNPPENIVHVLDNDMLLEICFSPTIPLFSNTTEARITQRAYFKLKSEKLRPLNDFTEIAYKLTELMCFAIDATVTLKNLSATSVEIQREDGEGKTYPTPVLIYYRSIPYSEKVPNKSWQQMLFSYRTIKSNAEDVFNNWINAYATLFPAISLYFSTKYNAHKYLEGKFLALAQGLETYHRRTSEEKLMDTNEFNALVSTISKTCPDDHKTWLKERLIHGNEINLRKRLKQIIEPFKSRFGNSNERKKLLEKIVDTRNYLTHYNENLKDKAAEGKELSNLYQTMEIIFQLHFLKMIGLGDEEINSVIENCYPLKYKINDLNSQ